MDVKNLFLDFGIIGFSEEHAVNGEKIIRIIPDKDGISPNYKDMFTGFEVVDCSYHRDLSCLAAKSLNLESDNKRLKMQLNVALNRIKDLEGRYK